MQEYQILPILILKIIPINKYTFKIIHTSLKIKSQKSIKKKKKSVRKSSEVSCSRSTYLTNTQFRFHKLPRPRYTFPIPRSLGVTYLTGETCWKLIKERKHRSRFWSGNHLTATVNVQFK